MRPDQVSTMQPLCDVRVGSIASYWPSADTTHQIPYHQNFSGDDFWVSKIKVMQTCLNKFPYFIVRRIGAFAVLEYHHRHTDAFAPIQYIESVRFP